MLLRSLISSIMQIGFPVSGPVLSRPGIPAPVAEFIVDDTTITSGTLSTFTDQSTGSPTSWLWEKNSGAGWVVFATNSTAQNPTETLAQGTWSIRLTATNAGGSHTRTRTNYIAVTVAFSLTVPISGTFTLTAAANATGVTVTTGPASGWDGQAGSVGSPGVGGGGGGFNSGDCTIAATTVCTIELDFSQGGLVKFNTAGNGLIISATGGDGQDGGGADEFTGFTNQVSKTGGAGGAAGVGGGGGGGEASSASANGNAGSAGGVALGGAGGTGTAGADGGAGGAAGNSAGLPGTGRGAGGGGGGKDVGNPPGGAGGVGSITIVGDTLSSGHPFNCTSPDVTTQPLLIYSIADNGGDAVTVTTVGPHGISAAGVITIAGTAESTYNGAKSGCTIPTANTISVPLTFVQALGASNTNTSWTAVGRFTYTASG